jgi:DNA polymerase III epsilon subunit
MNLDLTPFIILDVETTGLKVAEGDRVCEIGAIRVQGGKETGRFESLVNPQRSIPEEAQRIHNVSDEMVKGAPKWEEVGPKFRPFLAGGVIVAQNADFDMGFLNSEYAGIGMAKLAQPVVDTISLARRVRPGLATYKLDNLAHHFGATNRSRHRSIGDCEVTVKIFQECLVALRRRGEVRSIVDLVKAGTGRK